MIDLEFVERLIRSVDGSSIDSVEIERGGTRIRIAKSPPAPVAAPSGGDGVPAPPVMAAGGAPAPAPTPAAPAAQAPGGGSEQAETGGDTAGATEATDLVDVTSPMVGTFYRAPSPGADSFTDVGERISKGDTLCIIEAMKLMNELEAELDGVVREVCVENGEPVEYGQVLFRVEPE